MGRAGRRDLVRVYDPPRRVDLDRLAVMAKVGQIDLFTRRIRKAPAPVERKVHIAIADTLRVGCAPGWLWTHFPAGELRTKATGELLKRMGLKTGWSDFLLLDPAGRFHALELKRKGKKPTDEQQEFLAELGMRSLCHAAWVDNYDDAITVLRQWGALSDRLHTE